MEGKTHDLSEETEGMFMNRVRHHYSSQCSCQFCCAKKYQETAVSPLVNQRHAIQACLIPTYSPGCGAGPGPGVGTGVGVGLGPGVGAGPGAGLPHMQGQNVATPGAAH
jgi:hypothetical protein